MDHTLYSVCQDEHCTPLAPVAVLMLRSDVFGAGAASLRRAGSAAAPVPLFFLAKAMG
jgi:hypothetical protein